MNIVLMVAVAAGTYFSPWAVIPYIAYLAHDFLSQKPKVDRDLTARIERLELERSI